MAVINPRKVKREEDKLHWISLATRLRIGTEHSDIVHNWLNLEKELSDFIMDNWVTERFDMKDPVSQETVFLWIVL